MKDVHSKSEVDALIQNGAPLILHFWAEWCEASKPMDKVFTHLSVDFPHAVFVRVLQFEPGVVCICCWRFMIRVCEIVVVKNLGRS